MQTFLKLSFFILFTLLVSNTSNGNSLSMFANPFMFLYFKASANALKWCPPCKQSDCSSYVPCPCQRDGITFYRDPATYSVRPSVCESCDIFCVTTTFLYDCSPIPRQCGPDDYNFNLTNDPACMYIQPELM